jgi:hypothetical protein
MTGTQSWGDPGQSRESGGAWAENATYPHAGRAETSHQPATREPSARK